MENEWWPTAVAIGLGLLAVPISYGYTLFCSALSPQGMLGVAGAIMTTLMAINALLTRKKVKNKMYYGFALFIFSGVIDILAGLEIDGIATGFLTLYFKHGEPYLMSAWGAVVSYWDGTVHVICYLTMAYLSSNGRSYRTMGLHWSASILNSMIVLLLGGCLSLSGLHWCTLLNTPYVLFPLAVLVQCLAEPSSRPAQKTVKPTWLDIGLIFLLIEASLAALLKGLATFGSKQSLPAWYRTTVEQILQENEPAPFAAIQGVITLFYFLPGYIAIAWGLLVNPAQSWLRDLAVILAGATLHAGASIVGMTFHHMTVPEHRIPPTWNLAAYWSFWAVNLLLCAVPQLVAVRLLWLTTASRQKDNRQKPDKPSHNQERQKRSSKKKKEN